MLLVAVVAVACGGDDTSSTDPTVGATSTTSTQATPTQISIATSVPVATAAPTRAPTQPPAPSDGPSGKVVAAISGIGPDQYELFQLAWPWNDRNQFMGIYDTLFYDDRSPGADALLVGSVASNWQFTADALVLTIRDDVPWHNTKYGNLTVEDVLWSLERTSAPGTLWTRAEALTTNYKVDQITQTGPNEITLP
ncbi:MAG: hypothetical protein O3B04_08440 [Chloroflexi bacterium]|nr:hypothetical protein [Chloroflexota bacterium]